MHFYKFMLATCILIGGVIVASAQQGVTVSGATAMGTGGSATYSIGQVDYANNTSNAGTITQGVQQPYEIYTLSGVEVTGIQLHASVHPNPTQDYVILTVDDMTTAQMNYIVTDLHAQPIMQHMLDGQKTTISLGDISAGSYYIKVLRNNKTVKTFKIIKI
jgi:hypothetical protein